MKQIDFSADLPVSKTEEKKQTLFCKRHKWCYRPEDFVEYESANGTIKTRCRYCLKDLQDRKIIRQEDWKKEKEEVSDYYVRKMLSRGKTALRPEEIPYALVRAKQASIKLKRAVEKAKEPLVDCKKHGKFYKKEEVIIRERDDEGKVISWRCKQCMSEMHHNHYLANRDKILEKHVDYRKKNAEKIRKMKANYKKGHRQIAANIELTEKFNQAKRAIFNLKKSIKLKTLEMKDFNDEQTTENT